MNYLNKGVGIGQGQSLSLPGLQTVSKKVSKKREISLVKEVSNILGLEKLLTPAEVAGILRRPVRSIYELISARKIVAVQDGRRFKFRLQDVKSYIDAHLLFPTKGPEQLSLGRDGISLEAAEESGSKSGGDL